MNVSKLLCVSLLFVLLLGVWILPPRGISAAPSAPLTPTVGYAVQMDLSPALRDMSPLPAMQQPLSAPAVNFPLPKALRSSVAGGTDPVLQSEAGITAMPAPLTSFDGVSNVNSVHPPDTQGDIGYDPATGTKYYVQWVNLSFAVWDVTDAPTQIYGPANGNTLWQGFGGACETTNHGDPITLFDPLAHRWLMSQFSINGPYYQCIAISQTADPTGSWYRYAFLVSSTKMNDYPKFGVWPDGYYMTVNQFTNGSSWGGAGVFVFERAKLLTGNPAASFQYFDLYNVNSNFGGMLPSDLDGSTLPPEGAPNYFMEVDDSTWIGPNDAIRLWEFHVDWTNPANTTFGFSGQPNVVLNTAAWTPLCTSTRACIPQPGTSVKLDAIGDRLMYRLAYRNFGDHESLVVNHTVDAGSNLAGVRWYEVRDPGGSPVIYQQSTYAPDSTHRWMGSVAMDAQGNLALGYSVSSSSVYPSVRYAGRLANDPLGTLPQAETSLVAGSGYQTSSYNRWGDYSMMGIDPVDDCTFWYTQEYLASSGYAPWVTRIGSFRFPSCTVAEPGTLRGVVWNAVTQSSLEGATVEATPETGTPAATTSGSDGVYVLRLEPGVYTVAATAYGYYPYTHSGVEVTSATTTTLNVPLTPIPSYVVSGTITDAQSGWPLYAHIHVEGDPQDPPAPNNDVWTDPVTGHYSLTLAAEITYTLRVEAWVAGYSPATLVLAPLTGNATHNVALHADMVACNAPGYRLNRVGTTESFTAGALPAGWSLIDNAESGVLWRFNDPKPRGNRTGGTGSFAILDSDYAGFKNVDAVLRSPAMDFSGETTVILEFKYDFRWYMYGLNEVADVDVSTNDGTTWTNVWRRSGADDRGPKTARVDISVLAAGQANVRVRFHYYNANYEWWWQVDDVFLGNSTCLPATGGLVVGEVSDANTGAPVAAALRNDAGFTAQASLQDAPGDGAFYTLFAPAGTHVVTATLAGYAPGVATVAMTNGGVTPRNLVLGAGLLALAPESLELTLAAGLTATRAITLSNSGGFTASFTLEEVNAPFTPATPAGPFAGMVRRVSPKELHAFTAAAVREYFPPDVPSLAAGDVIQTWQSGLVSPWGVAFDTAAGVLWLSDTRAGGGEDRNVAFQSDGTPTGASLPTSPWVGVFAADMAYDPVTGRLWQVNVGGDNCIYELDPATQTATGRALCPPFGVSERGLAYDPTTDTFYSGSWGDQILYHFDATGSLLDSYDLKLNIAGLAYNPATRHLFVMSNASVGRDVYVLDVTAGYTVMGGFDIEGLESFEQAGLALDCSGSLWMVNQATGEVIQAVSGETNVCAWDEIPWLTTNPMSGTVGIGSEQAVALNFDTAGMAAGTYPVHVRVANTTPYGVLNFPITLTVVEAYDVSLAPAVAAQSGAPGAPVTYTFTVTNAGLVADTFSAALSGGLWEAAAPSTVGPLEPGASAALTVGVTVPPDAGCGATDAVTLTVASQGNSVRTAAARITTSAAAVYGAQVAVTPAQLAGDPGAVLQASLWVTNTGNCGDTFALSAAGPWAVTLPPTTGAVQAGGRITVPVTVTIPVEALAGEAAVTTLRATSQADTGVAATALLTATANAVYGVILDAAVTSGETLAGRTITYTVGVTNTGDYTDTFDLTVAGNAWPVTLSQDSVELGAQAGTAVQVEVAVPAAASGGDSDTTTFTAMSRGDASVSESLSLTTTVRECVAVAGAAFSYTPAQPLVGQTVTFTGTVTAGTLPITYAWDFGDEGTASGAVVAHAFPLAAAVRPYTVTLTVTNACGQVSASHVLSVRPHQVYLPLVMRLSD
ncbi:MAG TPA: carboxypeptidase regulatory-like domain-containing protein [Anaerolineae bacterium]|nr:carboxypeptidase regulatory-like domain-containing protein [Anaerolineae bacterium]